MPFSYLYREFNLRIIFRNNPISFIKLNRTDNMKILKKKGIRSNRREVLVPNNLLIIIR